MKIQRVCGHSFVQDLIRPSGVALDCGVNKGDFSSWLAHSTDTRIYGFEPDPRLFPELPKINNAEFHQTAVTSTGDPITLHLADGRCSTGFLSDDAFDARVEVSSVSLESFCRQQDFDFVDLIKLDIEGAELGVLCALSPDFLRSVGQFTVEFHDFLDASQLPEIRNVIARLRSHDFAVIKFSHFDFSDVLFVNRRAYQVDWRLNTSFAARKYSSGFARVVKRGIKTLTKSS